MTRPTTIFLDVNETLLDLTALKTSVGKALGGREELLPLWFTTMLQHSLVASAMDQYENFGTIGVATMQMVARNQGIELSEADARAAVAPIISLPPHPDVPPALEKLKDAGFQLYTLTNSSQEGVRAQMANAKLDPFLAGKLSVEEIALYKPNRHVYRWAARKVGTPVSECMMIAAHGWDVAGAMAAGLRAAFVSRPGQQMYPLAPRPELVFPSFTPLVEALLAMD
ncbi:haloacid dehalogenase type II [Flavilitoribacter nigricans]|uniref:Haloacid dehalogenase type II n=1 Tax=Flavilitoribacter nigricans (strain ATCC 23147 / DSM 23189 / NBRC 102662 / NCIMB 1420 / SS-2) TaxID=1122177 RepID=A0A2D0N6D0_FLAN2|nr:haloacid dehalogenase type II [Flavilitoribacter nigricans]PHN04055.1 haloacid dehalogenase type II [Flavilitoribacter nigricans DSM 23189 = NBRC 102662]